MNLPPRKILIVQPSWVGDAVMATPTLRAIRQLYPDAHITLLMKRYVKPVYTGMPWADRLISYRTGATQKRAGKGFIPLVRRLRKAKFDLAVLLPNSFQAALMCKLAGITRIVGYERDWRGPLLSDKLQPPRVEGKLIPSPIIYYYLKLAQLLGSESSDIGMGLFITPRQCRAAERIFKRCGLDPELDRPASKGEPPLIVLNPGAQYGAAKCWPAKYFAELADMLIEQTGATVLISAAPRERRIVDAIMRSMTHAAVDLLAKGSTLGATKDIVRRCDLMITNDTGPRHIAAAFDVPVVTVFGPTHPEWTEIYFPKERKIAIKVPCGPCQKKICPLDHRCMKLATPGLVLRVVLDLLHTSKTPVA